jgi:hypothetical protein
MNCVELYRAFLLKVDHFWESVIYKLVEKQAWTCWKSNPFQTGSCINVIRGSSDEANMVLYPCKFGVAPRGRIC